VSSLIFELSVIFKLGVRHKNSLLLKAHLKWVKNVDLNLHFNKPKLVSLCLGTGAEEDISFEGLTCPVYFFQPSFYLTPKAFGEHCLIGIYPLISPRILSNLILIRLTTSYE
jgi:hypothetical protein